MEKPLSNEEERNWLARLRTLMANERTLMAYYRTSFAIIGISAFIFKFYQSTFLNIISGILILAGIVLAIYGSIRYKKFIRRISDKNSSS